MDHRKTIEKYYRAIQAQDDKAVLSLFSAKGFIVHPIFGKRSARPFFKMLLQQTTAANRTLIKNFFIDPRQPNRVAAYLSDRIKTKTGATHTLSHVVHVFDFSKQGAIRQITVIFDTYSARKFLVG